MFTHNTLLISSLVESQVYTLIEKAGVADDQYENVILESIYDEYQLRHKCEQLFFEVQSIRAL
jgi:hypothetical protein